MSPHRFLRLGASLYVPAVRTDLSPIVNGHKVRDLRSLIICTEDAVRSDELPRALDHIASALACIEPSDTLRFVRVRGPEVLRALLTMPGVGHLDGFVLPKVTPRNLGEYLALLPPSGPHQLMVTLETAEVFDPTEMRAMARTLAEHRVLSARIGGNDLLGLLGLRRARGATIYDTPIGRTIADLVTTFRPLGVNLTAPVYDGVDRDGTLEREVALDLAMGLFGKTAIHPSQVGRIEALYKVRADDLRAAESVLDRAAPAVFLVGDRMCEPSTQSRWAELTVARAAIYGVD